MRAPKTVAISPFRFEIKYDQKHVDALSAMGSSSMRRQTIHLGEDQSFECERDTLLHEVLHMLIQQTPLFENSEAWSAQEEALIAGLTPRLLSVLRENPSLVAYLTEKRS